MLNTPNKGWTGVQIGAYEYRASYLTDVPMDLLDMFLYTASHYAAATYFDGEGFEYELMFSGADVYLIMHDETDYVIHIEDARPVDFIKCALHDIENDIYEWVLWDMDRDPDDKNNEQRDLLRKSEILLRIRDVKEAWNLD